MSEQSRRVNLKHPWEHASDSIEIKPDGSLVAELFDFSGNRGGDEAWGVTVAKEFQQQLLDSLQKDPIFQNQFTSGSPEEQLLQLLPLFVERFPNYHSFESWLTGSGVPFTNWHDDMA